MTETLKGTAADLENFMGGKIPGLDEVAPREKGIADKDLAGFLRGDLLPHRGTPEGLERAAVDPRQFNK